MGAPILEPSFAYFEWRCKENGCPITVLRGKSLVVVKGDISYKTCLFKNTNFSTRFRRTMYLRYLFNMMIFKVIVKVYVGNLVG